MSKLLAFNLTFKHINKNLNKMDLLITKIILFILLMFSCFSCAFDSYMFDGNSYILEREDKKFRIDSFKVVKVIDNRINKDSVIGNFYEKGDDGIKPLIINRQLTDYLKMMFNILISKDSSQNNIIPITLYIDEFNSKRKDNNVSFKYSFVLEFPIGSEKKSLKIENTINSFGATSKKQKSLIISGIKEAAKSFALNFYKDPDNSSESFVLDGSTFVFNDNDKEIKENRLDSFKIVDVIDNRKSKDSIIGFFDYNNNSLLLNRPLTDYLRMMFNVLIAKDSSKKDYIPVTVFVDEFFSKRWETKNNRIFANFKFSYWFEYPFKKESQKIQIIDSLLIIANSISDQKNLILESIKEAAGLFIWKVNKKLYLDSLKIAKPDTVINSKNIDTIDLTPYRKVYSKCGAFINYNYGLKTDLSIATSLIYFYKVQKSLWEVSSSIGLQYEMIQSKNNIAEIYNLVFPNVNRYYFTGDTNGVFLNGVLALALGAEKSKNTSEKFVFGLRLEETIGYHISDYISIEAGLYQQGYMLSEYLPYDLGLIFSLSLSDNYSLNK